MEKNFEFKNYEYYEHNILSEKFIEENKDKINWVFVCTFQKLSEKFIEKHINKIYWKGICCNQELSESFINKYNDKVDWDIISRYQKLSETFISKYKNNINWDIISQYQKLSETFINQFKNKVDWVDVCTYQTLSESFIENNLDKLNNKCWGYISSNQDLSESFIEKYITKINITLICTYQKLSESFIEKNIKIFKDLLQNIFMSQKLSESFIEKYNNNLWKIIFEYQKLSESFIGKNIEIFKDLLNEEVTFNNFRFPKLSEKFFEKYAKKINLNNIYNYQKLSKSFIKKHNINIKKNNLLYKSTKQKIDFIKNEFPDIKIINNKYIEAYKPLRNNLYGYNMLVKHKIGEIFDFCNYGWVCSGYGTCCFFNTQNPMFFQSHIRKIAKMRININDIVNLGQGGSQSSKIEVLDIIDIERCKEKVYFNFLK